MPAKNRCESTGREVVVLVQAALFHGCNSKGDEQVVVTDGACGEDACVRPGPGPGPGGGGGERM